MIISNSINFDNTLSVKHFAESAEAKRILNDTFHGNESQLFQVGQKVNSISGIENATITECYNQNGFWHYMVEYKFPHHRKVWQKSERQKDLSLYEVK